MAKYQCGFCDKVFHKNKSSKYCSNQCYNNSRKRLIQKCIDCQKSLKNVNSIRCNPCNAKERGRKRKIPMPNCLDCGKKLTDRRNKKCQKCFGFFRRTRPRHCQECGQPSPEKRGNRSPNGLCQKCAAIRMGKSKIRRVKVTCDYCAFVFELRPCEVKEHSFCSRDCYHKWYSLNINGDKHPCWDGGHVHYYGPNWHTQRQKARDVANYCCEICSKTTKENGKALDVHHKKPFKSFNYIPNKNDNYLDANNLDNLIVLCMICHRKIEYKAKSKSFRSLKCQHFY